MFKKVLIANRGEIACRVMRTCRRLGIKTVAVYSDADKDALHVEMADEAVHIGASEPRESYIKKDAVIAAAKQTGAEAIHPGYGFLSENAEFAEAVKKAGLVFIGPPASAILAMGGKSESKILMEKAKVPLTPGYHGENQDEAFLLAEAKKIGWPVLIKASAGGGGKGMRVVETEAAFKDALAGAKREAKAGFGNEKILLEKYLKKPRHVEIQVFGDTHGNYVFVFERDCSIQRRHQKVIEEAPAPNFSEETRKKMGDAAVAAAKAIKYEGAGTVEFLLDEDGKTFYFMEMNTRLQVEHPVSEMISGQDLVEWQLIVASGGTLPLKQSELKINGHAIEARLYAEDPDNNFLPGAGKIRHLLFPEQDEHVRVDTGVREAPFGDGDEISIYYDPMIAKLIVWGATRAEAIARTNAALKDCRVAGFRNNVEFLVALTAHPAFAAGKLNTRFIEDYRKDLLPETKTVPEEIYALAALGLLQQREENHFARLERSLDPTSPWNFLTGWRMNHALHDIFTFRDGDKDIKVTLTSTGDFSAPDVTLPSGKTCTAEFFPSDDDLGINVRLGGVETTVAVVSHNDHVTVLQDGRSYELKFIDPLKAAQSLDEETGKLTAPMPGRVVAVHATVGLTVKKGQALVIIEAMKMEHTITAPKDGTIETVRASVGEKVDEGLELIVFKQAG